MRGDAKTAKQPLTPFQWGIAYDLYAIGAAVTSQMSYVAALSHKASSFVTPVCAVSYFVIIHVRAHVRRLPRWLSPREGGNGLESSTTS